MRINKFFTEQGLCSRREADRLIAEGRVTINGRTAKLGDQVTPSDVVARDGTIVQRGNPFVYLKYHKPVGVTTTTEPQVRRNIIAEIGHALRIFPIGRLDKDSSGLILLTNDGDIVNEILRVEHGHEREYRVEVDRPFDEAFLSGMARGVVILGARTRPCTVTRLSPRRFRIILTEGRNRQIRRMCQAFGYRVVSLHRVRIMHITIDGLQPGQWKDLTETERRDLFAALGRSVESTR
ncbi:pseudouridine synthase [Nitrospirales bacterium NOB]|nr:23S rRNA pseudouridine(2604) synthase [Nitrospirota bacterium]MCE7966257.1 pseudouridine synthase [Nitrospira sp. NTP2]MCK6491913.1 pseudouridine synthase [Nitrospira sp.]MDL1889417.1 pseudouridine synthase [Nitrospirales bacterium NOB]MCK6498142.1 pseudouridine synthase [Nitrospira sp.]